MSTKYCKDCNVEKSLEFFNKNPNGILKVELRCKICQSVYNKKYRQMNKEKISSQRKSYYEQNKESIKIRVKKYSLNNSEKVKNTKRKNYLKNKIKIIERCRIYVYKRRKVDILFKLKGNLRHRLNQSLRTKKWNKTSNFNKYIGCTLDELKVHIEKQFTVGMTWDNYGKKEGQWSLDHIKPLSIAKTSKEIYKLCHFKNIQPMWHKLNIIKSNRI